MDSLRIFAASLNAAIPHKAYAIFDGIRLIFADIQPLQGGFRAWSDDLIAEVKAKVESGFAVLIDEKTDYVSQFGSKFDFEEESAEGKVNLYTALDYYFAFQNAGNIILPDAVKRFTIRESHAEKLQDEKGRTKYNIDWSAFNGGHRALLLCIMAVAMEPLSDRYLKEFIGYFGEEIPINDGMGTIRAIIKAYGLEAGRGV